MTIYYEVFVIILLIQNFYINIILSFEYRYGLDIDVVDKCQDNKCGAENQLPHTMCIKKLSNDCQKFHMIQIRRSIAQSFLMGHNGIRNKFAFEWRISNVNLMHWSIDLGEMAHHFLLKCSLNLDECNYIVRKNLTVGQNIVFLKGNPGARWPEKTIRYWYSELGMRTSTFTQFKNTDPNKVQNFTQMIWPQTEFVGCAAAAMFDGFLVVCYYHPKARPGDWSIFHKGPPCTYCHTLRPTCSRLFRELCGLDIPLPLVLPGSSVNIKFNCWILSVLCIHLVLSLYSNYLL